MNDRDFILLVEKYLDGSLSPEERVALRAEVQTNPARRLSFEEQARQHIRIHAQTSRMEFSESQHIAMMVLDIAERHKDPNAFMDVLRKKTLREHLAALIQGLRAGRDTVAYRTARAELVRVFGPLSFSTAVNVALILLIFCWVPFLPPPPTHPTQDGVTITVGTPSPPADLEPIQAPTAGEARSAPHERLIPVIPAPATAATPKTPASDDGIARPSEYTRNTGIAPEAAATLTDTALSSHRGRTLPSLGLLDGRDGRNRKKILDQIPGSSITEPCVEKSLRWLKAHQAPDGSWPGQDPSAMTGLALLTYLAHGELPGKPEFGDTVTRALKYLLARQDSRGFFSKNVYAHAIATYAIAEAFTMTRIVELNAAMDKGARVILNGQQSAGGFDYDYQKNQRFDTSVTGWQIQALKAAQIAGTEMPGLSEGLARAARFLETDAFSHDGSGFVYEGKTGIPTATGGKTSMTGVGTLCLQMLGKSASPQTRSGLRTLQKADFEWPETGKAGVYAGYYVTQAKFHAGDKTDWMNWNRKMQQTLVARQYADGHWEQGDYETGSHVYTTTLCTLMLEVYYRYLPTYAKRPESASPKKTPSGDISVDVR